MADERTIEAYVAGLEGWRATAAAALVALVREAAPAATGSIKWAQPVFDSNGPAVWIKAFPRWVSIASGAVPRWRTPTRPSKARGRG